MFCIGNVLNHDVYLQTALVLGYAPWKLAVGLPVANLWTLIESLMEEWRQYYRCCPSLLRSCRCSRRPLGTSVRVVVDGGGSVMALILNCVLLD